MNEIEGSFIREVKVVAGVDKDCQEKNGYLWFFRIFL